MLVLRTLQFQGERIFKTKSKCRVQAQLNIFSGFEHFVLHEIVPVLVVGTSQFQRKIFKRKSNAVHKCKLDIFTKLKHFVLHKIIVSVSFLKHRSFKKRKHSN